MTQNVNKAMWAGETSHRTQRAHSTCLQLWCWANRRRLSSFNRNFNCNYNFELLVFL